MDLNSLSLLVEILEAGNLSEAARRLKMTRANVSYHLNQFERSLGLQLVRRTTRRVEPTEAGLIAQVAVQRIVRVDRAGAVEMNAARSAQTDD